jgi:hypothetical protein
MNGAIAIPASMTLKSLIFGSITLLLPIRFDLSIGSCWRSEVQVGNLCVWVLVSHNGPSDDGCLAIA